MPLAAVKKFCDKLNLADIVKIHWLDSGKKFDDIYKNPVLSRLILVGHFHRFTDDAICVSSDYDTTEDVNFGTMNMVSGRCIFSIKKL